MDSMRTRINELRAREDVQKNIKYQFSNTQASHLVGTKREKLYEYYICDYCGDEIRIEKRFDDRKGGVITIPDSLTGCGSIKLALCNKCLKPVLKEFEEMNECQG